MNFGTRVHHVGIIQPTEGAAKRLMEILGLSEDYRGYVPEWSALCIFTKADHGSPIEFVIPNGGPLAKFNHGVGGLHHIALQVQSLDRLRERLDRENMQLLAPDHVQGAGKFLCNFLGPIATRGVTVEFVELID
jgi:catechol 2,3-dioxygenase-like lactoylglutathione lyase family enzyme